MSAYEWPKLINLWEQEKLDADQMIGHLLQWGQTTHQTSLTCTHKLAVIEQQLKTLVERLETLEKQSRQG